MQPTSREVRRGPPPPPHGLRCTISSTRPTGSHPDLCVIHRGVPTVVRRLVQPPFRPLRQLRHPAQTPRRSTGSGAKWPSHQLTRDIGVPRRGTLQRLCTSHPRATGPLATDEWREGDLSEPADRSGCRKQKRLAAGPQEAVLNGGRPPTPTRQTRNGRRSRVHAIQESPPHQPPGISARSRADRRSTSHGDARLPRANVTNCSGPRDQRHPLGWPIRPRPARRGRGPQR
jgi:hypothetical protein